MAPPDAEFLTWVTQLVHRYRARLAAIARAEGLLPEDALDCVQEAFGSFLLLPQARALLDVEDDAAKLLTIISRNIARNRRRRSDRARPHATDEATLAALPDDAPAADELLTRAGDQERLCGCVSQLNELSRQIVLLRTLDEVPGEDVAAMLGLSAGHVAVLLHRAKARLRACMETQPRRLS